MARSAVYSKSIVSKSDDGASMYSAREWEAIQARKREERRKAAHANLLLKAGMNPGKAEWLPEYGHADAHQIPSNAATTYKEILKLHPWHPTEFTWMEPKKHKGTLHRAIDRFMVVYDDDLDAKKAKELPKGCTRRDEVICLVRDVPIQPVSKSQRKHEIGDDPKPGAPPGSWTNPTRQLNSFGAEDFFSYRGEWRRGKMAGSGVFHFALGGEYKGLWSDGRQSGYGETTYKTGAHYEGEWLKGRFHGHGKLSYTNGTVYEGGFSQGQRSGHGKITYPHGQYYEGNWEEGLQHGRGEMANSANYKYVGSWRQGQIAGSGSFILPDGTRIVRFWRPSTFAETLQDVREEIKEEEEARQEELEALLRPLREKQLADYVADVRWAIEEEERRKEEEEEAELRRMLLDRREKLKQAKLEALEAEMERREQAEKEK